MSQAVKRDTWEAGLSYYLGKVVADQVRSLTMSELSLQTLSHAFSFDRWRYRKILQIVYVRAIQKMLFALLTSLDAHQESHKSANHRK